jgi:hypothetical protein
MLSWNEIRHRAIAFARDWKGTTLEKSERQTFWNEFCDTRHEYKTPHYHEHCKPPHYRNRLQRIARPPGGRRWRRDVARAQAGRKD